MIYNYWHNELQYSYLQYFLKYKKGVMKSSTFVSANIYKNIKRWTWHFV